MPALSQSSIREASRRITLGGLVVALALAILGGCSGSAGSTGSLPQVAASTTTSVAATTTQAPTAATADVRQAIVDYWVASRVCGQRPARCQPAQFTAGAGSLRATFVTFVATLVQNGYYFAATPAGPVASSAASSGDVAGGDVYGSFVVVETVTVDSVTNTAQTTECVYDPTPLLGPPGADGQPTVVGATTIPRRFQHTVYLEGGTWRVGDERVPPDTTACSFTDNPTPAAVTNPPR